MLSARTHSRESGSDLPRVVCLLGDFDMGGVPRVYLTMLEVLVERGHEVVVVAPDGEWRPRYESAGIAWAQIDWDARAEAFAQVGRLLEPTDVCVQVFDRRTLFALPALAAVAPTMLSLHSSAPRTIPWVGEEVWQTTSQIVRALCASGRLTLGTIGANYAQEYAEAFGVDRSFVGVLVPAVPVDDIASQPAGDINRVLCLGRLSVEKRSQVEAGVALVTERRAAGFPAVLEVVGDGPWRAEAEAYCAAHLPQDAYGFHGQTWEPITWMHGAGTVLATGLTALEAACAGARVVLYRTTPDDRGPLGPVFKLRRYEKAAADSFGWRNYAPRTVQEVWAELDEQGRFKLARLEEHVRAHNSPSAAADSLINPLLALGRLEPEPVMAVLGQTAARLHDQYEAKRAEAEQVWIEREWFRQKAQERPSGA